MLNVLFGAQGIVAHQELVAYTSRLEQNIEQMEDTRSRLQSRANALRTSAEAVRLEARELGYYEPGEQPVRVEGFTQQEQSIQAGRLLNPPSSPAERQPLFRVAALSSGLVAFFLLLL